MSTADQLLVALAVTLTLMVVVLALTVRKWWRSYKARRRARRAVSGEREALTLLHEEGFTVEESQARRTFTVCCDGERHRIELRADFLVERGTQRFVADVKTGGLATRITTAATRRQLLEYLVAYDVSGVLLLDMERRRVRVVSFDLE